MGPVNQSQSSLPSRPKFSWDGKNVPWTDGFGPQDKYADAVSDWEAYHDLLPSTNSNKYVKQVRGMILKSQLFGRASDLARGIPPKLLQSEDGASHIVHAIHKRDPLAILSTVYADFNQLVNCRRGASEAFSNYETRFAALLSRFNSHGKTIQIPPCITAFMLMSSAAISDNHRVSILAAAAQDVSDAKEEVTVSPSDRKSNADLVSGVQYETIASILRQCERQEPANHSYHSRSLNPQLGRVNVTRTARTNGSERLSRLKSKYACKKCGKYGHWQAEHRDDGSLKNGVPSFDKPKVDSNNKSALSTGTDESDSSNNKPKAAIGFTCSVTSQSCLAANQSDLSRSNQVGPLVDDGAPYSAIGEMELTIIKKKLIHPPELEQIPSEFSRYDTWQYGTGDHASRKKAIIGSVVLYARTDGDELISIRHLVIQGSSGWVLGRNLTRPCDILHIGSNALLLPNGDRLSQVDVQHHSFVPMSRFTKPHEESSGLSCLSAAPSAGESDELSNWTKLRRIIDRVHRHTCGHASYSDMRTLLTRNNMWNDHVQQYLATTVADCTNCKASSTPPPNRRVSISSLDRSFNDIVCIDHFHLENVSLFHVMDVATRFSAAHSVISTSLDAAIYAFELTWISQFWLPGAVHADGAFQKEPFTEYLTRNNIRLRPVPPRRHQKNMIEPRHGVIRSIFIRLRHAEPTASAHLLSIQAVRISNDLYGNDVVSSFELAKGFTRPVTSSADVQAIPDDVIEAHVNLSAKRKLNKILRSNSLDDPSLHPGDLVQVFVKNDMAKRGAWSSPRAILSIDHDAGFVTVPGRGRKLINAAFEDTRSVPADDALATIVQSAIDEIDSRIDEMIDKPDPTPDNVHSHSPPPEPAVQSVCDFTSEPPMRPDIDSRVEVFWPEDNKFYPGAVAEVDDDGRCVIKYDDDEMETLNMANETWRYEQQSLHASNLQIAKVLSSNEQSVIQSIMDVLGQRPFLLHHAQGFEQSALVNAYEKEEGKYVQSVERVQRKSVPRHANIVSSHVVYKIKIEDDNSLRLKARIAPHGNEDSDKTVLSTDCCMCSPTGIRVIMTIAADRRWRIVKLDVEMAFHQSGPADRKVYVIPPKESRLRNELWLLLVAGYGLVNANSKWQVKSDTALLELGLEHVSSIPQLFSKHDDKGNVTLLAIKIVDDVLACGSDDALRAFVNGFGNIFKLGTICHGPGKIRFYGMWIEQHDDRSCTLDADEKLNAIEAYPISRVRRRQYTESLNAVERTAFMSINSSISWLGTTVSPLCAFYSSYLQQKLPSIKVESLISQINKLNLLKRYGTVSHYGCPPKTNCPKIVSFADASHTPDGSQLCFMTFIVYGSVSEGSTAHILSWSSHKSRRPVRSTPAAEILAASEALDSLVLLRRSIETCIGRCVESWLLVDSKDLYNSLTTQRNSVDRSVRADVNCIRFLFETELTVMGWLPGSCNPADVGAKQNSPLTDAVMLMLATGRIPIDLSRTETKSSAKRLG